MKSKNNRSLKISIITPSYNQGQFLEETILSVINQDYPNLEYIIIDGGSTDNSIDIIKKYEKYITYWVSKKDNGQSDAINKGFHIATGDILHWLNSDDLLVPGALNEIATYFERHPEVDCVIGDQEVIDEKGNILFIKKAVPFHFNTALYSGCLVPQPASPFTRRAWEMTGDLDINLRYQMDFEYYIRMAKAGIKFGLLKKAVARFRLHKDSKTVSEYSDLVRKADLSIKERYLSNFIIKSKHKEEILDFMKLLYKTRIFLLRVFYRGDFIPFKSKKALNNIG